MTIHDEIEAELARALAKYPDCERLPDGTGASGYRTFEAIARQSCERAYREGRITHAHIFEEEAAEVLAAEDPAAIRKELIQVAAMAVKWVRDIDRKTSTDCQGTSRETEHHATDGTSSAKVPRGDEVPDVVDRREAMVPGNGVEQSATPSASGATDQEPAGRRDLAASQTTEASPQGEVGRSADGGAVCYGPGRCEVCGWTLSEAMERGCVPGNCSYRPDDPEEKRRLSERRSQIAEARDSARRQVPARCKPGCGTRHADFGPNSITYAGDAPTYLRFCSWACRDAARAPADQAPPPSSSESLKVAGVCDVCGQVYQGHPNRHVMCDGKPTAAPRAEVPRCRPWCGGRWKSHGEHPLGEYHIVDEARDHCFCSRACRDAARPLNPAPAKVSEAARREAVAYTCCSGVNGNHEVFCTSLSAETLRALQQPSRVAIHRAGAPVVRKVAALEAELAEAKERVGWYADTLADTTQYATEAFTERDAARAEVEELRAKPAAPAKARACNCMAPSDEPHDLDCPKRPAAPAKASERVRALRMPLTIGEARDVTDIANEVAALEAELAEAKAMVMRRPGLHACVEVERDAARAEVEQLKAKLDREAQETRVRSESAGAEFSRVADALRREADAREAAMQAACAKVARDAQERWVTLSAPIQSAAAELIAQAIERLPLSTGEACVPTTYRTTAVGELCTLCGQSDAIKAAVTAANNRAADAFHAWTSDIHERTSLGRMTWDEFEAWLRSGAPAPTTVKP